MSAIKKLSSEQIVAFHVAYAKLPGSDPMCALFLSQVSYWCARADGGIAWITHQAMYEQTGMSRKQQDRAAAYWASQGVMEKFIKGIPPKIHYSIDFNRLEELLLSTELEQNDVSESGKLDVQKGHHVMSERGKTSREDSKDSLETPSFADEQQPERAAEEPTTPHLSGPALTSDLPQHPPIPAGSTPHSPLPPSPRRKARFVPPTEQEWLDYCRTTFPLWKETAAKSVHAYYESVQWKGKVDWKACAKTCFYRAKPWDLLPAPVASNGGCYSSTLPRI